MIEHAASPSGGMVYARDLKSLAERHAGSIPASGTIKTPPHCEGVFIFWKTISLHLACDADSRASNRGVFFL